MKIAHSLIVLTSLIFLAGSMLTVGMGLKATTNNVSTNVIKAKQKYDKEIYLNDNKMHGDVANKRSNAKYNEMDQMKAMYKMKLESLNQSDAGKSKNAYFGKRMENRMSID